MFVTEACEYTNSFLSFFPTMEIILNIEADHLDFFKDIDDIPELLQAVCRASAGGWHPDHKQRYPGI